MTQDNCKEPAGGGIKPDPDSSEAANKVQGDRVYALIEATRKEWRRIESRILEETTVDTTWFGIVQQSPSVKRDRTRLQQELEIRQILEDLFFLYKSERIEGIGATIPWLQGHREENQDGLG
jgi:hypothetical protein